MSLFVNPAQFGPGEDFSRYPRDLARDADLAREAGTQILYAPGEREVYPPGFGTAVTVEGLDSVLEGASRPGHFRGVATVVTKLLNRVSPHIAFFGQKDAQQAVLVRRMVRDLEMDVEIEICPTVREADGLALSSRNVYLNAEERRAAPVLFRALGRAESAIVSEEERDPERVLSVIRETVATEPLVSLEYAAVVANHMSRLDSPAMVDSSSGAPLSGNEVTYGTYGMYLYYCSNCEVSDNALLYLSYHQVSLQYCTDTVVSGNVIVDTDDYYWNSEDSAIDLYSCERTVIVGNDISGVADTFTGYVGIYVQMAEDTLIEDNSIASRYAGIVMGYFFNYYSGYWTNDTRIVNNSMDDVGYGVYANGYEYYGTPYLQSNLTISGNDFGADYYGAYANMARHVDMVSNTVSTEWGSGFGVYSSVDVNVSDNVFAEGETGLYIGSSVDVIVSGNDFSDCRRGAEVYEAVNLTVVDNQFLRDAHRGLRMSYVVDAYLSGNVFESDGILIEGYSLEHFASHEIPTDNTVNGLPVYYYKDLDGFVFDGVDAGQLIFANCTDIAVSNLDIADTDVAVELGFVTSGLFQDIATTGTDHAFYTYGVTDVTVTRLTAIGDFDYDDDDWEDILFYDQVSTNLTITDSTMSDGYRGLQSYESTGLVVEDNLLESNYQGIMLDGTQGAYIGQNSVVESRYYGLRSYYMSDSEVSGNTLSFGEYGMYLYSSSDSNVTGNVLYNNMYGLRTYYGLPAFGGTGQCAERAQRTRDLPLGEVGHQQDRDAGSDCPGQPTCRGKPLGPGLGAWTSEIQAQVEVGQGRGVGARARTPGFEGEGQAGGQGVPWDVHMDPG